MALGGINTKTITIPSNITTSCLSLKPQSSIQRQVRAVGISLQDSLDYLSKECPKGCIVQWDYYYHCYHDDGTQDYITSGWVIHKKGIKPTGIKNMLHKITDNQKTMINLLEHKNIKKNKSASYEHTYDGQSLVFKKAPTNNYNKQLGALQAQLRHKIGSSWSVYSYNNTNSYEVDLQITNGFGTSISTNLSDSSVWHVAINVDMEKTSKPNVKAALYLLRSFCKQMDITQKGLTLDN